MASIVDICNIALNRIRANTISSLTESTREARVCNSIYEVIRDEVLEAAPWDFARKSLELSVLSETYTGWDYAYQYPTDCILARYIIKNTESSAYAFKDPGAIQGVTSRVKYAIYTDSSLASKVILTDQADAELVYTAKVTDVNMYSSGFRLALSRRLAAELAVPIKGKESLQATCLQEYEYYLARAGAANANEDEDKSDDANPFVEARL